jgi:flagellar biosynthesis protein FlhG
MNKEFPMDQASSLRRLAAQKRARASSPKPAEQPPAKPMRTLCVTSGKGGVGKTNLVVNLALAFTRMGRKTLILDADLGLANVDVVLGLNPAYTVQDVFSGRKTIGEVLVTGPGGVRILPAASGVTQLSNLSSAEKMLLLQALDGLPDDIDMLIVDTSAGISDTVLYFNIAAQERLVVATGEPTSLTDAYALMKVLYSQHQERKFQLVVNNVPGPLEAKEVYRKLSTAVDHFLGGLSLDYLGFIPTDALVSKAVIMQKPFLESYPGCSASLALNALAKTILSRPIEDPSRGNIKFFWKRLIELT